jgi:hypothetical protein
MKVEVVTVMFDEEFLAPFFFKHYSWVDRINVLLDVDTKDRTGEICSRFPNVVVEPFRFPDMMDEVIKAAAINKKCNSLDCDWIISADADEMVFPRGEAVPSMDPKSSLEMVQPCFNMVRAHIWQVYRHRQDSDLDPGKPAVPQRRHGDPDRDHGINWLYRKPMVVRRALCPTFAVGNHEVTGFNLREAPLGWDGVHWAMADSCFCVDRRVRGRRMRQSQANIQRKHTIQHHHCTEESVLAECEAHLDDPQLF